MAYVQLFCNTRSYYSLRAVIVAYVQLFYPTRSYCCLRAVTVIYARLLSFKRNCF